ncbi:MAG: hypothetical protein WBE58_21585, partial [Verrucomicrobiales bacterium]
MTRKSLSVRVLYTGNPGIPVVADWRQAGAGFPLTGQWVSSKISRISTSRRTKIRETLQDDQIGLGCGFKPPI